MSNKLLIFLGPLLIFASSSAVGQTVNPEESKRPPVPQIKLKGAVEVKSIQDAHDMVFPREKFKTAHFVQKNAFFKETPDRSKVKS